MTLPPGDWEATALGTGRFIVLRDTSRNRLGVYDAVEHWFGEVPFAARPT